MDFSTLELRQDQPIYQQLVVFVQRSIAAGTAKNGDELPSRRVLSALLGVNPNTVQRAYHLLEEEGLIQSRGGSGSCVAVDPDKLPVLRRRLLEQEVSTLAAALRQSGVKLEEAKALLERYWEVEP